MAGDGDMLATGAAVTLRLGGGDASSRTASIKRCDGNTNVMDASPPASAISRSLGSTKAGCGGAAAGSAGRLATASVTEGLR